MVEGITDAIAGFFGDSWAATPREIERISKPASRMIARNPLVKHVLKRFFAPAVLLGAIAAYVKIRRSGAAPAAPIATSRQNVPHGRAAEAPAGSHGSTPAPTVANDTPDTPEQIERTAAQAQNFILEMQQKAMSLG